MKQNRLFHSIIIVLLTLSMVLTTSSCGKADDNKSDSSKNNNSKTSNSSSKGSTEQSSKSGGTDNEKEKFHAYDVWQSASATTHTSKCTVCGKTETIPHVWNDGVVTAAPTASKSGTITYTCQLCAHTKTETVTYEQLNGNDYSAGRKLAAAYNPNSDRQFKIYGAAYSDDEYFAVYGECANGLAVLGQTEDGSCFAVDSTDGCFGLRMSSKKANLEINYSLWYNGKRVGTPTTVKTEIKTSPYDTNEDWKAMLGYDNQGFFSKMLPYYTNEKQLNASVASAVTDKFKRRVQDLKTIGNGCEIICVLAPSAVTTYPELVPEKFKRLNKTSYYDQVADCLSKAGVTVINLRSAFEKHKNDALPLFNKYDSHWTDYGAYIAYVELYNHISKKFPAAAPRKFSEFKWVRDYFFGGDIPSYLGVDTKPAKYVLEYGVRRDMASDAPQVIKNIQRFTSSKSVSYDVYGKDVTEKRTYNTSRPQLPSTWVIRNSFGTQIYDLIAERSNVSNFNPIFGYKYSKSDYEKAKPDYLIYIFSEWEFEKILNN